MKIGTDGVLLGGWAESSTGAKVTHILDIGTGTGVIALMLAQRYPKAIVHAIELEKEAAKQAQQNALHSPFSERICVFHQPLQQYAYGAPTTTYDLIVSNPPYFQNAVKAKGKQRTYARHTDTLSFDELLQGVQCLLAPMGTFCLILPLSEALKVQEKALSYRLYTKKRTRVLPKYGEVPKRLLLSLQKQLPNQLEQNTLAIRTEAGTEYTKNYTYLLKDFYLHF